MLLKFLVLAIACICGIAGFIILIFLVRFTGGFGGSGLLIFKFTKLFEIIKCLGDLLKSPLFGMNRVDCTFGKQFDGEILYKLIFYDLKIDCC